MARAKSKSVAKESADQPASAKPAYRGGSKTSVIISMLKSKRGATIPELMEETGWQSHSVRGFLAGALRRRHGLEPVSEKRDGELRRYRAR